MPPLLGDEQMKLFDIIYARVSTSEQAKDDKVSLPEQEQKCREYLSKFGYDNIKVFYEDYSGYDFERPQLDKIRELIERGRVRSLTFARVDRLSRKPGHLEQLREGWLIPFDVEVHSCDLNQWSWSSTHVYLQNSLCNFSELWGKVLKQVMYDGKLGLVRKGHTMASGHAPLGYEEVKTESKTEFQVIAEEAAIVREIYKFYVDEDMSLNAIARKLQADKIPTYCELKDNHFNLPAKHGSYKWYGKSVANIIRNSTYRGIWYFGKSQQVTRRKGNKKITKKVLDSTNAKAVTVPAIIEPEQWQQAQDKMDKNKNHHSGKPTKHKILMNRRLTCSCGLKMGHATKQLGRYKYYRCSSATQKVIKRDDCLNPLFRTELIDELAWAWLYNLLSDSDEIQSRLENYFEEQERLVKPLLDRLAAIDKVLTKKHKQHEQIISNVFKLPELAQEKMYNQLEQLEKDIRGQQAEREEIEKEVKRAESTTAGIKSFVDRYHKEAENEFLDINASFQKRLKKYGYYDMPENQKKWHANVNLGALAGIIRDDKELTFEDKKRYVKQFDLQGTLVNQDGELKILVSCALDSELLSIPGIKPIVVM